MKKIVAFVTVAIIGGYMLIQTSGLTLLKLVSDDDGGKQSTTKPIIPTQPAGATYKDGTYKGTPSDAFYGNIQVQVVISKSKITDVVFLSYPNDRPRSIAINTLAMPNLKQEAITAQSANVDVVSGATDTSNAFMQSLASALSLAK